MTNNRGCPNCGYNQALKLRLDAVDACCSFRLTADSFFGFSIEPLVCANFRTVYVDGADLAKMRVKVSEREKERELYLQQEL
jgi:hypothetical protein